MGPPLFHGKPWNFVFEMNGGSAKKRGEAAVNTLLKPQKVTTVLSSGCFFLIGYCAGFISLAFILSQL